MLVLKSSTLFTQATGDQAANDAFWRKAQKTFNGKEFALARIAFFIGANNRPFSDFKKLCLLHADNGTPNFSRVGSGIESAYHTPETCCDMLALISEGLYEGLAQDLQQSMAYMVMLDETTDRAAKKQFAIWVAYLDSANLRCIRFLDLVELAEGCDAAALEKAVLEALERAGVLMHRLVGVCTDGASVMTGAISGVCARLKKVDRFRCLVMPQSH